MQEIKQFTILLVGDSNVGKTTFMNSLSIERLRRRLVENIVISQVSHHIYTVNGSTEFTIIDMDKRIEFPTSYQCYEEIDAVIFMTDVTSRSTYENVSIWRKYVRDNFPDVPTVTLGNKIDYINTKVNLDAALH